MPKDDQRSTPAPPLARKEREEPSWGRTAREDAFGRFEDLTRKLVHVPKKEVDKLRKNE